VIPPGGFARSDSVACYSLSQALLLEASSQAERIFVKCPRLLFAA